MKRKATYVIAIVALLSLTACLEQGETPDAFGNFEVQEVMVSAEVAGKVLLWDAGEGEAIPKGRLVAVIDSSDLQLKKDQLLARRNAVAVNKTNVLAEVAVLEEQAVSLRRELDRTSALLAKGAAPQRQYDELESQLNVVERKIAAIRTRNAGILSEVAVIDAQIEEVDARIAKCRVINPVAGTVLVTYAEQHELTSPGRPLYKIAALDTLYLRAYVSGSQLSQIALGDAMTVQYDGDDGNISSTTGILTWVSSEAEFTPKIIQTREDRVNLVYAIKVRVVNDGSLKIGMPGEVVFHHSETEE